MIDHFPDMVSYVHCNFRLSWDSDTSSAILYLCAHIAPKLSRIHLAYFFRNETYHYNSYLLTGSKYTYLQCLGATGVLSPDSKHFKTPTRLGTLYEHVWEDMFALA
jgi:hypothetical protein